MSSHVKAKTIGEPVSTVLADAHEKRFVIARNRSGAWVVVDRMGQVGGLFISKEAACHFVFEQSFGHLEELELVDGADPASATHPLAA